MTKRLHSDPARAARTALALLVFVASAVAQGETSERQALEHDLALQFGEAAQELLELSHSLDAAGLSVRLLHDKLREGVSKKIDRPRLLLALRRIAENLLWVDEKLVACSPAPPRSQRQPLAQIGAEALGSGVSRTELQGLLERLCGQRDADAHLRRVVDLYLYLTQRLAVTPSLAWSMVVAWPPGADDEGNVHRLVATLREIQQRRGQIDKVVEHATERLRAGVPLHRLRNELREQFLRDQRGERP